MYSMANESKSVSDYSMTCLIKFCRSLLPILFIPIHQRPIHQQALYPPSQPQERKQKSQRLTLTNTRNRISLLIRNLDRKLLFDGHDDLYGVEAVETEVFGEGCLWGQL
jgi:hypothetical protein